LSQGLTNKKIDKMMNQKIWLPKGGRETRKRLARGKYSSQETGGLREV
jgi:hypothetical protein